MKKIVTALFVLISVLSIISCKNEMKKEIFEERQAAASNDVVLSKEKFVPFQKCAAAVSSQILPPGDAIMSADYNSSKYPIIFMVRAGNKDICIPKVAKFIRGGDSYSSPATDTSVGYTLDFCIFKDDLGIYVDGTGSGEGYLAPGTFSSGLERMDQNSELTYTGFRIRPNRTAYFRFTGTINELLSNPAAVFGGYRFKLLRMPVMLRGGAPSSEWTTIDFSNMNYSMSSGTPPPGHQ